MFNICFIGFVIIIFTTFISLCAVNSLFSCLTIKLIIKDYFPILTFVRSNNTDDVKYKLGC
jgi:hypothetical protein